VLSDIKGFRFDYENGKFNGADDGFTNVVGLISKDERGNYTYTNNIDDEKMQCKLIQQTNDYYSFLIIYPQAIWLINVYPNEKIAYINIQRVMLTPCSIVLHAKLNILDK
jgi:hypothetical protein